MKRQQGFTLIELLIVIAIIGVLAAVAVPSLAGYISGADKTAQIAEIATVQTAVDAYRATEGEWPDANFTGVDVFIRNDVDFSKYQIDSEGTVTLK